MAMLAEKRSKTRYNVMPGLRRALKEPIAGGGFGQRLMEKMGWANGKGLGANEDGEVNPIYLKPKSDARGLGFSGVSEDIAVAQQQDFDALLATLSQGTENKGRDSNSGEEEVQVPTERTPKSLEQMSKKSRSRVHYQKFTRGKDLSRASSKDLASILGMSVDSSSPKPDPEPQKLPDVGPALKTREMTFGITVIPQGNSIDYFKKKFEEKKRKMLGLESEDDSKRSKLSVDPELSGDTEENPSNIDDSNENSDNTIRRKKKKKKDIEDTESFAANTSILNSTLKDEVSSKERRKSVTWGEVEVSFVSKYIKDMQDTSGESLNDNLPAEIMDSSVQQEEKKSKRKKKENHMLNTVNCAESDTVPDQDDGTSKKKKLKKKKMKHLGIDEVDKVNDMNEIDFSREVVTEPEALEHLTDQNSKKKKKRKKTTNDLINEEDVIDGQEGPVENSSSKEKKKKKEKDENLAVEPLEQNGETSGEISTLSASKKKKKKDKLKKAECTTADEATCEEVVIQQKNKKKRKLSETGEISEDKNLCFEETKEKKKKKKEKHGENLEEFNEIKLTGNTEANSCPAPETDSVEGVEQCKKKKKKINKNFLPLASDELENPEVTANEARKETDSAIIVPSLSNLTHERMAKWKNHKNKNSSSSKETISTTTAPTLSNLTQEHVVKGKKNKKNNKRRSSNLEPEKKFDVNSVKGDFFQDYNHRRVFVALGCDVQRGAVDKVVTINMPSSEFQGSNLDQIPGYGQTIKSC